MNRVLTTIVILVLSHCLFGQQPFSRVYNTVPLTEEIALDGKLSELVWKSIPVADSFVTNYPAFGESSPFATEVRFTYSDQYLYIGARLKDVAPDSVLSILSQRDDFGNADWFGVLIDPYGSGQNAFGFYVTAAGVELDAILTQTNEDYTWNAVWKSRVILIEEGWSLEMRIPLSQLRFPEKSVNAWKINFKRQVRRRREMSYWSPVDPQQYGEIAQSGKLEGMKGLASPLRLSFSPYTTGYVENSYQDGKQVWDYRQRFGMDMKYGLSESFTLDATLIPDFGQTVSDRLILNLSPFEVRYDENRPFFLEGMDLFGIGDMFYTRRIGGPIGGVSEKVDSLAEAGHAIKQVPGQAQLLNALKISGRTNKGLGIGVFNAIENKSYVIYSDSTGAEHRMLAHPLSNYSVFVLSQNLKNAGNVSFINTNVYRAETKQVGNVSGAESLLLTKNRDYELFLSGKMSALDITATPILGHGLYARTGKVQGAYTFSAEYYEMSDSYDQNDLGYLERNNYRGGALFGKWTGYKPTGRFLRRYIEVGSEVEYLYAPGKFAFWKLGTESVATFRNFLTVGFNADVLPLGQVDHFESRTFGMPLNVPASFAYGGFYSTDYSKPLALDVWMNQRIFNASSMINTDVEISPRVRFSNRFFVITETALSRYLNNYGYVFVPNPAYAQDIIIGTRDRWIVRNTIAADYIFTNRMGVILRFNHYWQEVAYSSFNKLAASGDRIATTYNGISDEGKSYHNTSYNAFTLDLSYRWVVYPGSEIRFVWKYNIYASKSGLDQNYFYVFKDLFDQPQLNSFSIRALFFLDAGKLKKRRSAVAKQ